MSRAERNRVAAFACVDIRTVEAYLAGRPQHSTTLLRVEAALRKLGFGRLVRERAA